METVIIVREEESVEAVLFVFHRYGVDFGEKGPYLAGVAGHYIARDLPEKARQELLPIPGVMLISADEEV